MTPPHDATDIPVAPHAGAWIETIIKAIKMKVKKVAPHAGAWIETWLILMRCSASTLSRPTRAGGLKLITAPTVLEAQLSRPTRARGLKREGIGYGCSNSGVAPHAGAWIETS